MFMFGSMSLDNYYSLLNVVDLYPKIFLFVVNCSCFAPSPVQRIYEVVYKTVYIFGHHSIGLYIVKTGRGPASGQQTIFVDIVFGVEMRWTIKMSLAMNVERNIMTARTTNRIILYSDG